MASSLTKAKHLFFGRGKSLLICFMLMLPLFLMIMSIGSIQKPGANSPNVLRNYYVEKFQQNVANKIRTLLTQNPNLKAKVQNIKEQNSNGPNKRPLISTTLSSSRSTPRSKQRSPAGNEKPILMMWTFMWEQWWDDLSAVVELDCGEHQCVVTRDKSYLSRSDVVMLLREFTKESDLPPKRFPWQPWILVTAETPRWAHIPEFFDGHINYTCTYHKDSDLPGVYGHYTSYDVINKPVYPWFKTLENIYKPPVVKDEDEIKALTEHKEKEVLWISSHCGVAYRNKIVSELKENGLKVDTYGTCGQPDPCHREEACLKDMGAKYHFYLSFENTHCEDYITEKVWRALERGMVPIVAGASKESYKLQLPPDSFIHVDSFNSTPELAKHMKYLMENKDAYMKYHKWRETYKAHNECNKLCTICQHVGKGFFTPRKAYDNLSSNWHESKMCY